MSDSSFTHLLSTHEFRASYGSASPSRARVRVGRQSFQQVISLDHRAGFRGQHVGKSPCSSSRPSAIAGDTLVQILTGWRPGLCLYPHDISIHRNRRSLGSRGVHGTVHPTRPPRPTEPLRTAPEWVAIPSASLMGLEVCYSHRALATFLPRPLHCALGPLRQAHSTSYP